MSGFFIGTIALQTKFIRAQRRIKHNLNVANRITNYYNNCTKLNSLMFAIVLLYAALTATLCAAHGGITNPLPIDPVPAGQRPQFKNFHTVRGACGAAIPNTPATVNLTPGATFDMTFFVFNGDGAGPISAQLDATGTGKNFKTNVQVTKNIAGTRGFGGKTGSNAMTIVVPNTPCTNCLLRVQNPLGFGSCVKVNIVAGGAAGGAAPGNHAPANQAPAPAKGNQGGAKRQGKRNGRVSIEGWREHAVHPIEQCVEHLAFKKGYQVFVPVDYADGHCSGQSFVEFATFSDALEALDFRARTLIGGTVVVCRWSTQTELRDALFPDLCEDVAQSGSEKKPDKHKPTLVFLTRKNISDLLRLCKEAKVLFSGASIMRPFRTVISILTKLPWHWTQSISTIHRDHIFELLKLCTEAALLLLEENTPDFDPRIIMELVRCSMCVPGFTEKQKVAILTLTKTSCPPDLEKYVFLDIGVSPNSGLRYFGKRPTGMFSTPTGIQRENSFACSSAGSSRFYQTRKYQLHGAKAGY
ncbi:hypothetical protein HDU81_004800 [Chytriomyces hyalinus]|nr:hypothetical protein HDU81_004800 [Chytriomyces hyalinus]